MKRIGVATHTSAKNSAFASNSSASQQELGTINATQINFASNSNLMDLGEMRIWKYFIQICLALEVIHDKGIVHADLKPSNVLMTGRDYDLKLTDFGIS